MAIERREEERDQADEGCGSREERIRYKYM
jgi:hypothetical protein